MGYEADTCYAGLNVRGMASLFLVNTTLIIKLIRKQYHQYTCKKS